ncbi:MAG: hypothetical protein KDD55_00360 [Bdellovibrionales bacterium]|nr:hypothetical protein [Bdellovibrionales bacterium]
MDSGEVIPGLSEDWTFMGAKVMEWGSGFVMAMIAHETILGQSSRNMPIFLGILLGTTFLLAGLRKSFPDENRGVANITMVQLGMKPPGIPTPAALQPIWSGAPIKAMSETKEFIDLGLDKVFHIDEEQEE